ncbi:uncharacterized protein BXZ73DRAFT_79376 [Epithele typhae]|uniref:uncharacterized protein n=1 Tax=Epithele typhae TaxID=378194 RepID=UPI002007CDB3|nr:uncharacterized protein BXZ73DRAFT_79376 [Epithele typhae]KAH9923981.1 hypothetical protein BXZ73DRAFT_79376 [Epithele typhae]
MQSRHSDSPVEILLIGIQTSFIRERGSRHVRKNGASYPLRAERHLGHAFRLREAHGGPLGVRGEHGLEERAAFALLLERADDSGLGRGAGEPRLDSKCARAERGRGRAHEKELEGGGDRGEPRHVHVEREGLERGERDERAAVVRAAAATSIGVGCAAHPFAGGRHGGRHGVYGEDFNEGQKEEMENRMPASGGGKRRQAEGGRRVSGREEQGGAWRRWWSEERNVPTQARTRVRVTGMRGTVTCRCVPYLSLRVSTCFARAVTGRVSVSVSGPTCSMARRGCCPLNGSGELASCPRGGLETRMWGTLRPPQVLELRAPEVRVNSHFTSHGKHTPLHRTPLHGRTGARYSTRVVTTPRMGKNSPNTSRSPTSAYSRSRNCRALGQCVGKARSTTLLEWWRTRQNVKVHRGHASLKMYQARWMKGRLSWGRGARGLRLGLLVANSSLKWSVLNSALTFIVWEKGKCIAIGVRYVALRSLALARLVGVSPVPTPPASPTLPTCAHVICVIYQPPPPHPHRPHSPRLPRITRTGHDSTPKAQCTHRWRGSSGIFAQHMRIPTSFIERSQTDATNWRPPQLPGPRPQGLRPQASTPVEHSQSEPRVARAHSPNQRLKLAGVGCAQASDLKELGESQKRRDCVAARAKYVRTTGTRRSPMWGSLEEGGAKSGGRATPPARRREIDGRWDASDEHSRGETCGIPAETRSRAETCVIEITAANVCVQSGPMDGGKGLREMSAAREEAFRIFRHDEGEEFVPGVMRHSLSASLFGRLILVAPTKTGVLSCGTEQGRDMFRVQIDRVSRRSRQSDEEENMLNTTGCRGAVKKKKKGQEHIGGEQRRMRRGKVVGYGMLREKRATVM